LRLDEPLELRRDLLGADVVVYREVDRKTDRLDGLSGRRASASATAARTRGLSGSRSQSIPARSRSM
jgi:hypothetical protein